jgi:hypothetical protein
MDLISMGKEYINLKHGVQPARNIEAEDLQGQLPSTPHADVVNPKTVMQLQRTIGNKAVQRLLQRTSMAGLSSVIAREETATATTTAVSGRRSETPTSGNTGYGWNYKYNIRFTDTECCLTIKVKLTAKNHTDGRGLPTADEVKTVKTVTNDTFKKIWDNKFVLTETDTKKRYDLRASLDFVDSDEDLSATVYKGNGRDTLDEWHVERPPMTRAHELGHQLGLLDEYIDPKIAARATATSPGVHTDHSIMGNYHSEGPDKAEAKLRHGQHIATDIASATRRSFSMVKR